jgi:hypothetical protein
VVYFCAEGPQVPPARTLTVTSRHESLFKRYGVPREGATYVFRPDGHVLARCTGIDAAFAREAIESVLDYRAGTKGSKAKKGPAMRKLSQIEADRMYDALSALIDSTPKEERERVLARLVVTLAERLGDYAKILEAIKQAKGA